jgi:hypothetical protein
MVPIIKLCKFVLSLIESKKRILDSLKMHFWKVYEQTVNFQSIENRCTQNRP